MKRRRTVNAQKCCLSVAAVLIGAASSSVSSSSSSSSTFEPHAQAQAQHASLDIDGQKYYFDTLNMEPPQHNSENEDEEDDDTTLIHIPIRSRASVLKERNLLHVLNAELDESAIDTFRRWAGIINNDDDEGRLLLRSSSSNEEGKDDNNYKQHQTEERVLQEFSGEGTHFLDAYIGNPAQKRVLAVSSGADFTAFPCEVRVCKSFLVLCISCCFCIIEL